MWANKIADVHSLISSSGTPHSPLGAWHRALLLEGVRDIDRFFNDKFPLCYGSQLVRSVGLARPFPCKMVSVKNEKNIFGVQNKENPRHLSMCCLQLALSPEAE